jgi:hypothetical protein
MMKLDGSAAHKHIIRDFKLTRNPIKTSNGTKYVGTASVSMLAGQLLANVPTTITLFNDGSMSILVDPRTTNLHFGNTPIQGKIITPSNLSRSK